MFIADYGEARDLDADADVIKEAIDVIDPAVMEHLLGIGFRGRGRMLVEYQN